MNAGRDFDKACKQAKANAKLDDKPRYLHSYNGVLWLGKTPPTCGHWIVMPSGEVSEVKE